jgi:hypothetical protein
MRSKLTLSRKKRGVNSRNVSRKFSDVDSPLNLQPGYGTIIRLASAPTAETTPMPKPHPLLNADVIYWTAGSNAGEIAPRAAKIIHVHEDETVSLVMWTPYGDPVTHVGIAASHAPAYGTYTKETTNDEEK